jgi:hypothetical protein
MLRSTGLENTGRIFSEMNALLLESEVTWTPRSA